MDNSTNRLNQSHFSTNTSFRIDDLQNSSMVISDDEATQHLHSIRDTLHSKDLIIEKLRQYSQVLQREYEAKEADYTRQIHLLEEEIQIQKEKYQKMKKKAKEVISKQKEEMNQIHLSIHKPFPLFDHQQHTPSFQPNNESNLQLIIEQQSEKIKKLTLLNQEYSSQIEGYNSLLEKESLTNAKLRREFLEFSKTKTEETNHLKQVLQNTNSQLEEVRLSFQLLCQQKLKNYS